MLLLQAAGYAQQQSAVRIHADGASGYGFSYGGPQRLPGRIVTALHLVAGKKTILVMWGGKQHAAAVEKIYPPSDLALLKLNTAVAIPQLSLYRGTPPLDVDLNYWQISGSGPMQGMTTQLEHSTVLSKLNARLDPQGFANSLCRTGSQTFPALSAPVLKFADSNVRKAHSGSPITQGTALIGMIDGGEKLVNSSVSLWAIPASEFDKLFLQGTVPQPALASCESPNLYSGQASDNPLLSEAERQQARDMETRHSLNFTDTDGSAQSLSVEYELTYGEVFETLFEEDAEYLASLIEDEELYDDASQLSMDDLADEQLRIYHESGTGATLAIPSRCTLGTESASFGGSSYRLITATSPYEGMTMYIFTFHGQDLAECQEAMEEFRAYMDSDGQDWQTDEMAGYEPEDFLDDETDPYYNEWVDKFLEDEDGNILAQYFLSLTIEGTDFLGVAVQVNDWETLDEDAEERKFYYLLEACAIMTDFPYY
ncbi:MAG: hypothetical protein NW241_04340 [Bacteroidia bacterium]|nr:hypothetical protein [Bacteroidia bacterium]